MSTPTPAEVLGPVATAIDHVGFAVRDLDAAIFFPQRGEYLQRPLEGDGGGHFFHGSDSGIQQVAFRVTDVDVAAQRLRDAGLRLLYDAPRRGTAGSRVNFVHPKDCGGVLVELVEPAPH